jgi:hypothetical protein
MVRSAWSRPDKSVYRTYKTIEPEGVAVVQRPKAL